MLTNSLSGPVGTELSASRLAETGDPLDVLTPDRATYSATRTVRSLTSVEVASGHHHRDTPRVVVPLPEGPWVARFYVWVPALQQAGHGLDEVRTIAQAGPWSWVLHETAAGNLGARLHTTDDLLADSVQWDDQDGSAVPVATWWRVEMTRTGQTLTVRAAVEDGNERFHQWHDLAGLDGAEALTLTGYRWRRGAHLEWDQIGEEVENYQHKLLDLGYELPTWGADGHYGQESVDAFEELQSDVGLTVDAQSGVGPDTLAALDLAHAEDQGESPQPPVYLSHLAVAEGDNPIGPAPTPSGTVSGALGVEMPEAPGHKVGCGSVSGALVVEGITVGHRIQAGAHGRLTVTGSTTGQKNTSGVAVGGLGLVGTVSGRKIARGTAAGTLGVSSSTAQGRHPVPALGGRAVADQLAATATREGEGWLPSNV